MKALVDISAGLGSYLGSFLDHRVCVVEGLEAITSRSRGDLGKSPSRGIRRSKRTSESPIRSVISGKKAVKSAVRVTTSSKKTTESPVRGVIRS